ncbi:dipeptidase [Cellulomonas alba]|uniref:Dipeptidase n=1 Tax=Cellulomonas alba TaxID=3053467 RepID=A0ABT7SJV8_9CELL|nr:dipeptidase [Cellulomonas alba]MDM7856441.1 dipeptidase [Cellulomonas alba]
MGLRERVDGLMGQARTDLAELVAIPSVADARQYPPEECARAAQWVLDAFAAVGFRDAHLAETADGSQAVVGSRPCGDPDAPTVLLYAHYDVQPPLNDDAWRTPPFALTESDGRWYGRGAADCKGNIVMHLTALRALGHDVPVNLKLVVEGSEEQGTGGLEAFVPPNADLLRADAILVADTGNAAVGVPAATVSLRGMVNVVVGVEALASEIHSGMFGGPAPDALAALVAILASLRDEAGDTTVAGLDHGATWTGEPYPTDQFRADAGLLDGIELLGSGTVSDMLWARPALTILGIDAPPVLGSAAAISPTARARLNLRIPPGTDPRAAERALRAHLAAAAPWGVRVTVETEAVGSPFRARTDGPAYAAMSAAMQEAYGRPMATLGQGGSIPLCTVLAETYPDAELFLMGVEEPQALIHAPNESVDPSEIAHMALVEALFLQRYAGAHG